jgi:PKHD-type hydroxylase
MEESNFIADIITCEKVFTPEECNNIIHLFNSETNQEGSSYSKNFRVIRTNHETGWLFNKIGQSLQYLNKQTFNFNLLKLENYVEVYRFKENDFFDWKKDLNNDNILTRKINLILFLSENTDYKGGAMEFFSDSKPVDINKIPEWENKRNKRDNKGNISLFPTYVPYRMEPVTEGEKFILVTWAIGPRFY